MGRQRAVFFAVILALVLAFGVLLGLLLPPLGPVLSTRPGINASVVLTQVQGLSHLVTVKYVLEKVVILEDVKWYGENRLLLLAHGVVKAGIDLGQIKPEDIVIEGRSILLRLPRAMVTDAYLDEKKTRVIERSTGLMRTADANLEQNARQQAVNDIRIGARNSGIYEEAEERAHLQLRAMLTALGFERVDFKTQ
ncbi:MAG: DUF4230 domain-containing protein [Verrucomicrobia bacterium]|nr:DUF4230 domain-containing protein [Verrucomicrobiota bacterium]